MLAVLLLVAMLGLGWLAFRTAAGQLMPPGDPRLASWVPDNPDVALDRAMIEFVKGRGAVSPTTMEAVAAAARRAPLDARPFLLFGVRDLVRGDDARALSTFESGRRLDGRQRWIRLLLLDRYLRTRRYDDAATEFAVLARLISAAQAPILEQLARMTQDPATRDAVRQTLARDPGLENSLLTTLARSNPNPQLLFSMASPAGRAAAGAPGGWGDALVETMVARGRYAAARSVWRRVHAIPASAAASSLYDAGLRGLPGGQPFNWSVAAANTGAADLRNGELVVTYYGRETGPLAGQLLVLAPGRYRLAYTLAGASAAGKTTLSWNIRCAGAQNAPALLDVALPSAANAPRRYAVRFAVPATGCAAQQLALMGNAADFPTEINAAVSALALQPTGERP